MMMPGAKRSHHRWGILAASCLAFICAISVQTIPAAVAQTEQVALTVGQVIAANGVTAPPAETFTYRLTPKSAGAPMPAGSDAGGYTFSITGTGEVLIGPMDVTGAQVSSYELACITGVKDGYTIDTEVFTIDVYVPNDQSAITIVHLRDGAKAPDLSFTHHYIAPGRPSSPDDRQAETGGTVLATTGVNLPVMLIAVAVVVIGVRVSATVLVRRRQRIEVSG